MSTKRKTQPNRARYVDVLRAMTPEQRLSKAIELSDMTHEALRVGLRQRFPSADEAELHARYLERLERCRRSIC
ncbi:MAG: hypothetical protein U1E08_09345 [Coriobacteriia bacterium]|nr:hypothetical protein [Actinomycetota bacterium]MDZ4167880.1 hypothetical protein [Coriobacteriia bacterium]